MDPHFSDPLFNDPIFANLTFEGILSQDIQDMVALEPDTLPVSRPAEAALSSPFDNFRMTFDSAKEQQRYFLIRELACNHAITQSELAKYQEFLQSYQAYKKFNLLSFIADHKRNAPFACAKHFGQVAKLEMGFIVEQVKSTFLMNTPSEKFIAQFLGDHLIRGSDYEGADSSEMLKTLTSIISSIDCDKGQSLALLNELSHWTLKLDDLRKKQTDRMPNDPILSLATEIIDQLKQKGEVNIYGGYSNWTSGHAMIYRITKQQNGFQFAIINTGDGIQYHDKKHVEGKLKYAPLWTISNVPMVKLTSLSLASLLGFRIFEPQPTEPQFTAENIYLMAEAVYGTPDENIDIPLDKYITPQRSGTCVVKSILATIRYGMDEKSYDFLKFKIQTHLLSCMVHTSPEPYLAVQYAKNMHRHIFKLFESKTISFEQFFHTYALLDHIEKRHAYTPREIPLDIATPAQTVAFGIPICNEKAYRSKQITTHVDVLFDVDLETEAFFRFRPDQPLVAQLDVSISKLDQLLKKGKIDLLKFALVKWIESLPEIDNPIWNVDLNSTIKIQELLHTLISLYIAAPAEKNDLSHRLYLYFLLTKLARRECELRFPDDLLFNAIIPFTDNFITETFSAMEPLTADYFERRKKLVGWYESLKGPNWFYLHGDKILILIAETHSALWKFINNYLTLSGKSNLVPNRFDAKTYLTFFQDKTTISPSFASLFKKYTELFGNSGSNKIRLEERLGPGLGNLVYRGEDGNDVKWVTYKRIAPKTDISIYTYLHNWEKVPSLIMDSDFQREMTYLLFSSFITKKPLCLFEAELKHAKDTFLPYLLKLLRHGIKLTKDTTHVAAFQFLANLCKELHDYGHSLLSNEEQLSIRMLLSEEDYLFFYSKASQAAKAHCGLLYLQWGLSGKTINHNWFEVGASLLLQRHHCDYSLNLEISNFLFHHSEQLRAAFDAIPHELKKSVLQRIYKFDETAAVDIQWPKLSIDHRKINIERGIEERDSGTLVPISKQFKPNSALLAACDNKIPDNLIKTSDTTIHNEDKSISITKEGHVFVTSALLGRLLHFSCESAADYLYLPNENRSYLPYFFQKDSIDVWSPKDPKPMYMYLVNRRTGKTYRLHQNNYIKYITSLDKSTHLLSINYLIRLPGLIPAITKLCEFESEKEMAAWFNQSTQSYQIEMERFSLSFSFRANSNRIDCEQHPGYYLDPVQPQFLKWNQFIRLTNSEGGKLLLIPRFPHKRPEKLHEAIANVRNEGISTSHEYAILHSPGPEKLDGRIVYSGKAEDVAYYAHRLMIAMETKQAFFYLKSLFTNHPAAVLEKELKEILHEDRHYLKDNPLVISFKLHALYLLSYFKSLSDNEIKKAYKELFYSLLNSYSQVFGNIEIDYHLKNEHLRRLTTLFDVRDEYKRGKQADPCLREAASLLVACDPKISRLPNEEQRSALKSYRDIRTTFQNRTTNVLYYKPETGKPFVLSSAFHPIDDLDNLFSLFTKTFDGVFSQNKDALNEIKIEIVLALSKSTTEKKYYYELLLRFILDDVYHSIIPELIKELVQTGRFTIPKFLDKTDNLKLVQKPEEPSVYPELKILKKAKTVPSVNKRRIEASVTSSKKTALAEKPKDFFKDLLATYFMKEVEDQPSSVREFISNVSTSTILAPLPAISKINEDFRENSSLKYYSYRDETLKEKFKDQIQSKIKELQEDLAILNQQLSETLNNGANEEETELITHLVAESRQVGGIVPTVTLRLLLDNYLNGKNQILYSEKLNQVMESWITAYSLLQSAEAILKEENPGKIASILKSAVAPGFDRPLIERIKQFYQIISAKMMRQKQWKTLCFTQKSPKTAFQLGCGEGKTSVLSVALALDVLAKGRVPVIILPSGTLETNHEELRTFFQKHTTYEVRQFSFKRGVHKDLTLIEFSNFAEHVQKGRVVVVTDRVSLQSLLLKYIECIIQEKGCTKEEAQVYENLLSIFIEQGYAILDELQIVLDPLVHLNFALQKEVQYETYRWKTIEKIYRFMARLNLEMENKFPIGKDDTPLWSSDDYDKIQKRHLANALCTDYPSLDRLLLFSYFSSMLEEFNESELRKVIDWFQKQPETLQLELQMIRAQLNYYLPHTLAQRCNVHYGRVEGNKEAKPFVGNNQPSPHSNFQNTDILVNFTIQTYLKRGLEKDHVSQLAALWKEHELKGNPPLPLASLFGKAPFASINLEDSQVFEQVYAFYRNHEEAVYSYLELFVFSEFTVQQEKLSSSSSDLTSVLFNQMTAFSGTLLSSYLTLPSDIALKFDSKVNLKMLSFLLDQETTKLHVCKEVHSADLLKIPKVCMVLDPHAFLEGRPNKSVAEELLSVSPAEVTQINYFDEKSNIMTALTKDAGVQGEKITYCDQKHTTGIDTVQPIDGVGILLANKGLTFTELVQACMRLRLFGNGQKIELVLSEKLARSIQLAVGEKALSLQTFVAWTLMNESQRQEKVVSVAFEQQLHSIYRGALLHKLFNAFHKKNQFQWLKARQEIAQEYKQLLLDSVDNREFIQYASLEAPKTPLERFMSTYERYEKDYGSLLSTQQKKWVQSLHKRAQTHLMAIGKEKSHEDLNVTAQKEQRKIDVKETQTDLVERKSYSYAQGWNLRDLIENSAFTKWLRSEKTERFKINQYVFIYPFKETTPSLKLHPRFYASQNYLEGKKIVKNNTTVDIQIYEQIDYLFSIAIKGKLPKYVVIKEAEADWLLHALRDPKIKAQLKELLIKVRLYQPNGFIVAGKMTPSKKHEKDITAIFAQIHFLSGNTIYKGCIRTALKDWLLESSTEAKINYFVEGAKKKKIASYKLLHKTPVQEIFDEVLRQKR